MPENLGEHYPQFSVCKIASNAVPNTDGPGLERCVIVIRVSPIAFVEMALRDKFVRVSEIILGKVGA